jgi:hypothetical protein
LVRRTVGPDAVRAHQEESIHTPALRRGDRVLHTDALKCIEGDPSTRKLTQDSDQIDHRIRALQTPIQGIRVGDIAMDDVALLGSRNLLLASWTNQQPWTVTCVDQMPTNRAADETCTTDDGDLHVSLLSN